MDEKDIRSYGALTVDDGDNDHAVTVTKQRRNDFPRPLTLMLPFLALVICSYYILQFITVVPTSFLTIEQRANRILTQNPLIGNLAL